MTLSEFVENNQIKILSEIMKDYVDYLGNQFYKTSDSKWLDMYKKYNGRNVQLLIKELEDEGHEIQNKSLG